MPAGKTYVKIASQTLSGSVSSVTFSNLPQNYTDLVLVIRATDNRGGGSLADGAGITFNSDTSTASTNYSFTYVGARSSGTDSGRNSNFREIDVYAIGTGNGSSTFSPIVCNIMNYSNSTTYKTVLARGGNVLDITSANVGLWRSTAAVTSITIWPGYNGAGYTFTSGSTFTIYGIEAAKSPKADGGEIYSNGTHWFHVFRSSGVFRPNQAITADYLVVAGGGSGGTATSGAAGGGGAGGLRSTVTATGGGGSLESALSLTANTDYTVTVGAGGTVRANGSNSVFSTITSTGGGRGGSRSVSGELNGATGGSGGGGSGDDTSTTGGSGTANQGYGGGTGGNNVNAGGGGGGAGAVGSAREAGSGTRAGGAGGAGVAVAITGTSVTYAGGGGGGGTIGANGGTAGSGGGGAGGTGSGGSNAENGVPNTGGGGGGASNSGGYSGNGGSGIVIVRYAV